MKNPTILIVVDLQKGFVTKHSSHVVTPIDHLQLAFDHVIFTKFHNPKPSPFREILDYHKMTPHTEETEFAIAPREDAFVIERPLYTCMTQSLKDNLEGLKAKEAYVCGIATEACVLKTVVDLFEANIRPIVIQDLCASDQNPYYHKISLELITKLIGEQNLTRNDNLLRQLKQKETA